MLRLLGSRVGARLSDTPVRSVREFAQRHVCSRLHRGVSGIAARPPTLRQLVGRYYPELLAAYCAQHGVSPVVDTLVTGGFCPA